MRAAVISDVHGNVAALEAVLTDATAAGVTAYWVLGDLVAYGPRPAEVLDRLRGLESLRCVRGNTDRYVLTGDVSGMRPRIDEPRTSEQHRLLADVRESLAWTRHALIDSGHESWLRSRPVEERGTLPDRTRVLMVHASPGRDDGAGAQPASTVGELLELGFTGHAADFVLVGHTHISLDRRVNGTRIVNPGPVSLPPDPDGLARWALVTANEQGYDVQQRRTSYDVSAVVADLDRVGHPAAAWIAAKLTG